MGRKGLTARCLCEFDKHMTNWRDEIDQQPSLIEGDEWDAVVAAVCAEAEPDDAVERLLAA